MLYNFIEKPFSLFAATYVRTTTGGKIARARTSWRESKVEYYPVSFNVKWLEQIQIPRNERLSCLAYKKWKFLLPVKLNKPIKLSRKCKLTINSMIVHMNNTEMLNALKVTRVKTNQLYNCVRRASNFKWFATPTKFSKHSKYMKQIKSLSLWSPKLRRITVSAAVFELSSVLSGWSF